MTGWYRPLSERYQPVAPSPWSSHDRAAVPSPGAARRRRGTRGARAGPRGGRGAGHDGPARPGLGARRRPDTATGARQDPAAGPRPVALDIPAIGVAGPVDEVGLRPDGTLEVPAPGPTYDQPAWYRGSPTPGRVGPSVILGHVDSAANGPSVFY